VLLALPRGPEPLSKAPQYGGATGSPGPPERDDFRQRALAVSGIAPWALSALPECFRQLFRATGPAAFVDAKMPRHALRLPPGATLRVADCSVAVGREAAVVTRGENRLIVPPPARLFLSEGHLVLDRALGRNRRDLRIYALRAESALALPTPRAKTHRTGKHSNQ